MTRGHGGAAVAATVLAALLFVAGCGSRPAVRVATPSRLTWRVGETFTGAVTFQEQDRGAIDDELRFEARERYRVVRVRAGTATLRVSVSSWRWERNTSELLTTSLPAPSSFAVDRDAEIVAGVDWPLPSDLPLPGVDLFAAPLEYREGWSRTDGAGAGISYQGIAGSSPGGATLDWSVVRPQFTASGEPITVSGRGVVTLSSRYRRQGGTLTLRSTRERATFERTTQSAGGAARETGTILETTTFSSP